MCIYNEYICVYTFIDHIDYGSDDGCILNIYMKKLKMAIIMHLKSK